MEYQEKKCTKCKKIKPINEFYKSKERKIGYTSHCIECRKINNKKWQEKNIERLKAKGRRYYWDVIKPKKLIILKTCPICKKQFTNDHHYQVYCNTKCKGKLQYIKRLENGKTKAYKIKNAEKLKIYQRERFLLKKDHINELRRIWERKRFKEDKKWRLMRIFSLAIRVSLKKNKNGHKWEDLVGYTLEDLRNHLEKQFKPGMTFDNHGKWHIDHIIPQCLWQFETYNDREFKQCWSLANLQPLWKEENERKHNKLIA